MSREAFEKWYKSELTGKHELSESEANIHLRWVDSCGYVHQNTVCRYEGWQARDAEIAKLKQQLAEAQNTILHLKYIQLNGGE